MGGLRHFVLLGVVATAQAWVMSGAGVPCPAVPLAGRRIGCARPPPPLSALRAAAGRGGGGCAGAAVGGDSAIRDVPRRHAVAAVLFGWAASVSAKKPPLDDAGANAQILAGYDTLVELYQNWDKYAGTGEEANGDNVRRQVGTVGSKSPLFGIRKALLKRRLDLDTFEEFDRLLTKIDSDAYSAIFADSSTAPKRGYEYMKDAKKATKQLLTQYVQVLEVLGLEPPE